MIATIDNIQKIIADGENLLQIIPKKSDYKTKEKAIKDKYRSNEPLNAVGREILSNSAGEIASQIFGTQKKTGKSLASKVLKNQILIQQQSEINGLWQDYSIRFRDCEYNYNKWFSESVKIIELTKLTLYLNKFKDSKLKTRLETKLNYGLLVLNQTLHYLEKPHKKETLLIKTGEPLKGRKILKDFIKDVKEYVKIQEPYPTQEILEIVEDISENVKSILLIGGFKNDKDKEIFTKNLALLRKSGREIDVLSIRCLNTAPFHDRFFISEKTGITTGTSFSGLGMRDSIITELNEWVDIEKRFDEYMIGPKTEHRGLECIRERF